MTHRKSILRFSITVAAIALIGLATVASLNAQAQTVDSSQQIRNYLIKAIQALDNGDNSEAIRQLQLASDQIGTFSAVSDQSDGGQSGESIEGNSGAGVSNNDEGENDDEGEESEEGEGEDEDEPGDTDSNDEED
ncbi:MAG: hypothetical protein M3297_04280 [Thermoproteota archaeon]|nr:hypothetical protein [Thermoproteota archaeon]